MRRVRWAERTAITRFFSECSGSSGVQSRRGSFHPYCSGRILVALTPGHVESDLHDRRLVATVLSIACCCEGVWNISLPPPLPQLQLQKRRRAEIKLSLGRETGAVLRLLFFSFKAWSRSKYRFVFFASAVGYRGRRN